MVAPPRDDAGPSPAPESSSPSNEVDPELLRLPRPRPATGPILAVSLLLLSFTLMTRTYEDLAFTLGAETPQEINPKITGHKLLELPVNRYVTITATPDRASTLRVAGDKDSGHRLVPVQGTSGQLWLQISGQSFFAKPRYDERYTGRILPATSLRLAEPLAALLAKMPPQPRFLDPLTFSGGPNVQTLTGETIAAPAGAPVVLVQRVPQTAYVTFVATDRITTRAQAQAVLDASGIVLAPGEQAAPDTDTTWSFAVQAPAGRDAIQTTLSKARYFGVEVQEKSVRHEGPYSTLTASPSALQLGAVTVPRADVANLAVLTAPSIPAKVLVFVDGDIPKRYWPLPLLFAGLGIVMLFMIWSLWRSVRS